MTELLQIVEEPRSCPYLPAQQASLEYRIFADLNREHYAKLLARGYRRFGHQLYRPACKRCAECVSLRILVNEFTPGRAQRRVLRRNAHIWVERQPVNVTDEHIELFNRCHRFMAQEKGWPYETITSEMYLESFVLGGSDFAWQWLFYDGGRLAGVALMDQAEDAISLVYYFHAPYWRPNSPGTFTILTQLAYAKERRLTYAYPGYWIADNTSMSYKARYRPHERLVEYPAEGEEPRWERVADRLTG